MICKDEWLESGSSLDAGGWFSHFISNTFWLCFCPRLFDWADLLQPALFVLLVRLLFLLPGCVLSLEDPRATLRQHYTGSAVAAGFALQQTQPQPLLLLVFFPEPSGEASPFFLGGCLSSYCWCFLLSVSWCYFLPVPYFLTVILPLEAQ